MLRHKITTDVMAEMIVEQLKTKSNKKFTKREIIDIINFYGENVMSFVEQGWSVVLNKVGSFSMGIMSERDEVTRVNPVKTLYPDRDDIPEMITIPAKKAYNNPKFLPTAEYRRRLKDATYGHPYNKKDRDIVYTPIDEREYEDD